MNCYLNSQDQWLLILKSCKSCLAKIEARLLIFLKEAHKQNEFNTCVIVMIEEFRFFYQTIVVEYSSQYNDFLFSLLLRELDEGSTWMWSSIFEAQFPHKVRVLFMSFIDEIQEYKHNCNNNKNNGRNSFLGSEDEGSIYKKCIEIQGPFLLYPSASELRVYFNKKN